MRRSEFRLVRLRLRLLHTDMDLAAEEWTPRGAGNPSGRSLLNVAVSENGVDWSAALVLENSAGEYSYPAAIQTADGLVHITYTWRRERVRHVVVDPDALELTPIEDGVWPGLPEAGREE